LEESAFIIEAMYQSRMEIKVECNFPPKTIINARMKALMPMSCKTLSLRLAKVSKTYFYLENKYGVDLIKV
jgi:hypothetical protein